MAVAKTAQSTFNVISHLLSCTAGMISFVTGETTLTEDALKASVYKTLLSVESESTNYLLTVIKTADAEALAHHFTSDLSDTQRWELIVAQKVWFNTRPSSYHPEAIIKLLLCSFFVLIHSKISSSEIAEYVSGDSTFTTDLVSLGNVSRKSSTSTNVIQGVQLSHICLENILGLVESRLRRRSSMNLNSNILELLDLDRDANQPPVSTSNEDMWISIVTSACNMASHLLDAGRSDSEYTTLGKFVRLGLELYALALTIRDPNHIVTDVRLVSTIVGLLRVYAQSLKDILASMENAVSIPAQLVQQLLIVSKILYCLELTVEKNGYSNVFRECDGLVPIVTILEAFAAIHVPLDALFTRCSFAASILETAVSVVNMSISKLRPAALMNRTLNESGYSFLYSPEFVSLGKNILSGFSGFSDTVWGEFILLIKETIDFEPTYLSHFLQSDLVSSFKSAFKDKLPFVSATSQSRIDLDNIISPLIRFATAVAITADGKSFLTSNGILEFILVAVQHPLAIVPQSYGLSSEKVSKIGSALAQIMLDGDNTEIVSAMLSVLKSLFAEVLNAIDAQSSVPEFLQGTSSSSPRIQLLQRLVNICTLTESIFAEIRRHQSDFVRDVVKDLIPKLIVAYQCSLPPAKQLFAQMSLFTNTSHLMIGNGGSMRAITSLIKIATSNIQQELLHDVLKHVEETINKVTTSKMMLVRKESIPEEEDLVASGSAQKGRRNRSRGSSYGSQAGMQAHILGILDLVPDSTIVNEEFTNFVDGDDANERYLWQFTSGIVTIEWLSLILSHSLRSIHRSSNHSQISYLLNVKDKLRHLFSFLKSALLEVAAFSAIHVREKVYDRDFFCLFSYFHFCSQLCQQAIDSSKIKLSTDVFIFEGGLRPLPDRVPSSYRLRVISPGGALIREGVEIDGTRVVFVSEIGNEIIAYERKLNSSGVIRYRTDLGWISEYRRDQSKSPIVELIEVTRGTTSALQGTTGSEISSLLTAREGVYHVLSRLNLSLRQLSVYLSRILLISEQRVTVNSQYIALASSLSKYLGGFFDYSDERLGVLKSAIETLDGPLPAARTQQDAIRNLYFASFVKNALLPAIEDKNGNLNTILLRSLCKRGVISSAVDAFVFSLKTLQLEVQVAQESTLKDLSPVGRCAYFALHILIVLVRKLVNRDIFKKSTSNRAALVDDNGAYTPQDFLGPLLLPVCAAIENLLQLSCGANFCPDTLSNLLSIVGDLHKSIQGAINDAPTASSVSTESNESEGGYRSSSVTRGEFTSLRSRSVINRFVDMGFSRSQVLRCLASARDPNDFEEIYALLISSAGTDVEPATVLPPVNPATPVPPVPPQETVQPNQFLQDSSSSSIAERNDMGVDSLPNLVSNLDLWDGRQASGPGGSALPATPPTLAEALRQHRAPSASQSPQGTGNLSFTELLSRHSFAAARRVDPVRRTFGVDNSFASPVNAASVAAEDSFLVTLRKTSDSIEKLIIPFCVTICESFHLIRTWEKRESYTIFQHMRSVLSSINHNDQSKTRLAEALVSAVLERIIDYLTASASWSDKLSGLLIFCSSITPSENAVLEAWKEILSYKKMLALIAQVSTVLQYVVANDGSNGNFLTSIVPAVVFVSQLLSFVEVNNDFVDEQLDLLLKVRASAADGKDEEGDLAETKCDTSENTAGPALECAQKALLSLLNHLQTHKGPKTLCAAIADALSHTANYHNFAEQFVSEGMLKKLLALRCYDDINSTASVSQENVGKLLQKCIETPNVLQADFAAVIRGFFKALPVQESKIQFEKFLRGHATLIARNPEDFWVVCMKVLKFRRINQDNNDKTGSRKSVVVVELQEDAEADLPLIRKLDRAYNSLHDIVDKILSGTDGSADSDSSDQPFFSSSDAVNLLADVVLSIRNGAVLVSFVECDVSSGHGKNLVDSLLHSIFEKSLSDASSPGHSEAKLLLQGSTRLCVSLAAFRGESRQLVVGSIVSSLKKCTEILSDGAIEPSMFNSNTKLLQRLCKLINLVCQSTKVVSQTADPRKDQVISVDTIGMFLHSGGILSLLVSVLLNISNHKDVETGVLGSILELVELFTRPQLLLHIGQQTSDSTSASVSEGQNVTTNDQVANNMTERAEQFVSSSLPTAMEVHEVLFPGDEYHHLEPPTGGVVNGDDDEDEEDDEGDGDEGDDELNDGFAEDEDGDEEDMDEDEGDDDENDDDDEGDEGDENRVEGLGNGEHITVSLNVDGNHVGTTVIDPTNLSQWASALDPSLRRNAMEVNEDSYVNIDYSMLQNSRRIDRIASSREGFEAEDVGNPANLATPPGTNRELENLLRSLYGGSQSRGAQGQFLADAFRQISNDLRNGVDDRLALRGIGDFGGNHNTDNELLPLGLTRALESRRSTSSYFNPFVEASAMHLTHGSRSALQSRNGRSSPTIMQIPGAGGRFGMGLPLRDESGISPAEDLFADESMPMPAMWPSSGVPHMFSASSFGFNAPTSVIPSAPTSAQNADRFARAFQRRVESIILHEQPETGDESVGEGSQSSATLTSRGGHLNDGNSMSQPSTSLQAVQDPNPRQAGEEDSVRGGPIPPLIEIEEEDHEFNEEMSVLTLPQEEQTVNQDEDSSHTQLRVVRELQFSSGASAGSADDQETIRTTPGPESHGGGDDDQETIRTFPPINEADEEDEDNDMDENSVHGSIAMSGVTGITGTFEQENMMQLNADSRNLDGEGDEGGFSLAEDSDAGVAINVPLGEPSQAYSSPMRMASASVAEGDDFGPRLICPPGYDRDVFYSLPPDMQQEIIDQQQNETPDQTRELVAASGFDYDVFMSLPDDIRQEILEQARRQRAQEEALLNPGAQDSGAGVSAEVDNMTFLASLTLELRTEVLLTADQTFLDSLPPEIVAEAQTLRERAASSWQRRELMAHATANEPQGHPAPPSQQPAGGFEFGDDGDEEDEDEDEEDYNENMGGDVFLPRIFGNTRVAADNHLSVRRRPRNGLFSLPLNIDIKIAVPELLLASVAKVLLSRQKQSSRVTDFALQILQNVSHTSQERFMLTKLLVGLLVGKSTLVVEALHKSGDASKLTQLVGFDLKEGSQDLQSLATASPVAWRRIAFMMTSLSSAVPALTLMGLLPLSSNFRVEFSAEGGVTVLRLSNKSASTSNFGISMVDDSTESLLEELVRSLPGVAALKNPHELESLSILIDRMSSPLESLPENADNFKAEVTEEVNERDKKHKCISVPIPPVIMDRDSLAVMCDVLQSDLCNGKVLRALTHTLGRIAKFSSNARIIIELICDALGDVSSRTKISIDQFTHTVRSSTILPAATESAAFESAAGASLGDIVGEQTVPLGRVPSMAVIPLGDNGNSRMYDCFVRFIQTLQSIAERSSGSSCLYEIAPLEALVPVWNALDNALTALKIFLVDDESLEAEGLKSTPKLTSLIAAARKLLPLVESFFLIYAADLLVEVDAPAPSTQTLATTTVVPGTSAGDGGSTAGEATSDTALPSTGLAISVNPVVAPAEISSVAQPAKIPGQRYRTTKEYQRANIPLPIEATIAVPGSPEEKLGGSIGLARSRSFNIENTSGRYRRLMTFIQNHRALLNVIIKSKPALLESSFAPLVRIAHLRSYLSFEVKRKYFFAKLKRLYQQGARRGIHLQIRRNQIFEDTYQQLRGRSAEDMRGRLNVQFYGEQGIDAGGLTREWYMILSREIFNPNYALFMAAADGATFQPNPLSFINSNHLDYFKFVGRVIGKAICDGQLMDAHFTRSFYKHLLGMPIEFNDIETTEPDYYKSLKMMLEHPLEELGFTGMTFTAEIQKFGRTEDVDLIPNGSAIVVTDENKLEYVRLIAHHRMTAGIFPQLDSFLAGFYELVPPELICIFSPTELELLICGLPDVSIEELKVHTEYHQYRATDEIIGWFWDALRSFNREERALFLQFVTGTSKVGVGLILRFSSLPFSSTS